MAIPGMFPSPRSPLNPCFRFGVPACCRDGGAAAPAEALVPRTAAAAAAAAPARAPRRGPPGPRRPRPGPTLQLPRQQRHPAAPATGEGLAADHHWRLDWRQMKE